MRRLRRCLRQVLPRLGHHLVRRRPLGRRRLETLVRTLLIADDFAVTDAEVGMNFQGGGLRTGLEGRRYFFKDGWLSIYGKGDISLLLGDVNVSIDPRRNDPSSSVNPVVSNTQTSSRGKSFR